MKFLLWGILTVSSLLHADCLCLCSIFRTTGGEIKLCPKEPTDVLHCANWLYDVPGISDSRACYQLGENISDCKGYQRTERFRKTKWVEQVGGRFHSCRIIIPRK